MQLQYFVFQELILHKYSVGVYVFTFEGWRERRCHLSRLRVWGGLEITYQAEAFSKLSLQPIVELQPIAEAMFTRPSVAILAQELSRSK